MVEKEATRGRDSAFEGIEKFAWKANELADYKVEEKEGDSYLATYHLESGAFLEIKHKIIQGKKIIYVSQIDFELNEGAPSMTLDTYLTSIELLPDGRLKTEEYSFAYNSLEANVQSREYRTRKLAPSEKILRGLDIEHLLKAEYLEGARKMKKPVDFLALFPKVFP